MAGELQNLLFAFSQHNKIMKPRKDDKGRYFFLLENEYEVFVFENRRFIYFESFVMQMPEDENDIAALLNLGMQRQLARSKDNTDIKNVEAAEKTELTPTCSNTKNFSGKSASKPGKRRNNGSICWCN